MRFNDSQSLSPWPVSEAMAEIVTTSLRIGAKTDGAMDITVGPLVNLWGFGPNNSRFKFRARTDRCDESQNRLTAPDGHQSVASAISAKDLPDLYIDLSTVGEGYAADHGTLDGAGRDFPLSGVGGRRAEQPWYER